MREEWEGNGWEGERKGEGMIEGKERREEMRRIVGRGQRRGEGREGRGEKKSIV